MQTRPCPSVCYLHVLTKAQRKMGIAGKKSCQGIGRLFGKGDSLEDPFSKQTLRNYQPCVSTPKTPEQHKECANKKTLFISTLAQYFHPATWEEHPINNHDIHRVTLALAVSLKR